MRKLALPTLLAGVLLSGCSGSVRQNMSSVPAPSLVQFLPPQYRVVKTYRADLTGGTVPDVVVTSQNPREAGADLQVLSWNAKTRKWRLTFDGMTARQPNVLVAGPQAPNAGPGLPWRFRTGTAPVIGSWNDRIGPVVSGELQVAFAPLLGGHRDELVFGGGYVACCSVPGFLAVVNFQSGAGKLIYAWQGVPGIEWHIKGDVIDALTSYLLAGAAEVGPWIPYRFGLRARSGHIAEVYDTRPFLGVVLRYTPSGPPVVAIIARHGPAAGRLRPGDAILSVENGLKTPYADAAGVNTVGPGPKSTLKYNILDTMSSFHAGQTLRLLIRRGSRRLTVRVRLGSPISTAAATTIRAPKHDGIL